MAMLRSVAFLLFGLLPNVTGAATAQPILLTHLESKQIPRPMVLVVELLLADELHKALGNDIISFDDIDALLGRERSLDMLGCDRASCYSEIAGALSARFMVVGSLVKTNGEFAGEIRLLDTRFMRVESRAYVAASGFSSLLESLSALALGLRAKSPYFAKFGSGQKMRQVHFNATQWVNVYVNGKTSPALVHRMGKFVLSLSYGVHRLRFTNTFGEPLELDVWVSDTEPHAPFVIRLRRLPFTNSPSKPVLAVQPAQSD